ncbi:WbqC family protein [Gloeomargaritales cyanobacterium VI4D9]|nr:WbqC family protein [Gloeomargaritales cyanobacterium VI4D9]
MSPPICKVVISQPMYFPWIGMLEQIQLSDVFIFYDDVQFPNSGRTFIKRVQVKLKNGTVWMTIPVKSFKSGAKINEIEIDSYQNWQKQHLDLLTQSFIHAPFKQEALHIAMSFFDVTIGVKKLSDLSILSMRFLIDYFKLDHGKRFFLSSRLDIPGRGSERILKIVKHFGANFYITGHGARNYLDHESFDSEGIVVEYMQYCCAPYPQLHGDFTPFVSSLDLVANCGQAGSKYICSKTIHWKEFLYGQT